MIQINLFTAVFKKAPLIISAAACVLLLYAAQSVLIPKYTEEAQEGRLTGEYYRSEKLHDIVFIGDCEVYENIDPAVLWKEFGISSCVRGSPQQLVWTSYYLMKETLRYEAPRAFVFNVLAMKYGEPQNEAYNRLALDGMRFSADKIGAVFASMTADENPLSYIFPILRFHDRWKSLCAEDWEFMFRHTPGISCEGYLMRADVKGTNFFPEGQLLSDYSFSDKCWEYIGKMAALCRDNGVELILMKAPSIMPYWYDEWDAQISEFALQNGILYINTLQKSDETGIDYMTDTYDAGLHLNVYGAEKLSLYLGKALRSALELKDHRGETVYDAYWSGRLDFHGKMYEALLAQLKNGGSFSGYGDIEI